MKVYKKFFNRRPESQQGFVSLFTVVFFMILISVITIGFLRIMTIEQQQALDNDLTASALAAAESGIEDAKRVILKYFSMPSGAQKVALGAALTSTACNALLNDPTANGLGVSGTGSVNGQSSLNQYYTCLSVNLISPNYISSSTAGKSDYIPLHTENNVAFDQVKISWDLISANVGTDGDGRPSNYASSTLFPKVTGDAQSWSTKNYPAFIRAELYGYPNGTFTRTNMTDRMRSAFLVPSLVGTTENTPIAMDVADPLPHQFDQAKSAVQAIQCKNTPATVPVGTYACSATLALPSDPTLRGNNNNYYLRLTPLYGSTHYEVELKDSSTGNTINFSGVQPIVDVTGRASDVFRRIQARVRIGATADLPEFSAETAGDICKNMEVSDGSYFQPNSCP